MYYAQNLQKSEVYARHSKNCMNFIMHFMEHHLQVNNRYQIISTQLPLVSSDVYVDNRQGQGEC